ncbi:MAG: DUF3082 domain-containing protein, partial [Cyanobacteria bacterium P01_A01_bin.105]
AAPPTGAPSPTSAPPPLRCFTGAFVAGSLGVVMYRMTLAIATTFANKPVTSDNPTVISLSSAVRTLVTGMIALGAGVFGVAALGLLLLGLQSLLQRLRGRAA